MYRLLLGALGMGYAMAAASSMAASNPLEFSGNVYHMAVCSRATGPGIARCHAHVVTDSRGSIKDGRQARTNSLVGPSGYGPADLRSAYRLTSAGSGAITVAVVDAYGYRNAERDLGAYRAQYGLPSCTTANGCFRKADQNGGTYYPADNTGWAQETALDLDMVSAACPNCHILLVQAASSSFGNLATAVNTAARLHAHAISNSYGGGESGSKYYEAAYNHPGVAITVSSGDSGYGVQFPASSPHVTAVGGTSLSRSSNTRGWAEKVWNGAGSGCSSYYAKPTWQTSTLCLRRDVADVAAVADPNTGVAVYGPVNSLSSGWMIFGGTSVAAPFIAGVYGANGGLVNYGQDPYNHKTALFDVTQGTNGTCSGTYLCTAVVGYDGPTGLGTPNGSIAF